MESILAGLDVSPAVIAVTGACALIALVGFTKWAGKKVAGLFG